MAMIEVLNITAFDYDPVTGASAGESATLVTCGGLVLYEGLAKMIPRTMWLVPL